MLTPRDARAQSSSVSPPTVLCFSSLHGRCCRCASLFLVWSRWVRRLWWALTGESASGLRGEHVVFGRFRRRARAGVTTWLLHTIVPVSAVVRLSVDLTLSFKLIKIFSHLRGEAAFPDLAGPRAGAQDAGSSGSVGQ